MDVSQGIPVSRKTMFGLFFSAYSKKKKTVVDC
jgi:hypothetical protein